MSDLRLNEPLKWSVVEPLLHHDRRLGQREDKWVRSFCCADVKPLIICRGPVRKEAMDIFTEMGITHFGILLSEKDSVIYANALAPELRSLTDPHRVHRIPDYSGTSKEERQARVQQIIEIAHRSGYNSIFAGYGFMSEDADMVRAVEEAGLSFMGPSSKVQAAAGLKDEAKRTALKSGVSVTPGIDNATTRALLRHSPSSPELTSFAQSRGVQLSPERSVILQEKEPEEVASILLDHAHAQGIDLYTLEEVIEALHEGISEMAKSRPHARVRLKAISGGGGKGQRILTSASSHEGDLDTQITTALEPLAGLVREVLAEVKCLGVGDNKNVVAELNIEETSHQEIQVLGNGEWCITLGGRDCSLQMHEQKLLEISVTEEELSAEIALRAEGSPDERALRASLQTLRRMEEEATRFGLAVGLDSVSTFECIVSGDEHYFMEMNTRIQVEHRVTELCYGLRFTHPEHPHSSFEVHSLIELMVLLARHGKRLPLPTRIPRCGAAVEVRINATNDALKPHAGGVIQDWSPPLSGEVRDDQGISFPNPDTGAFMRYHLAGAYDSNIALLLTVGGHRRESYEQMAEVLRLTKMEGDQLCTNLHFHYGLIHWLLARDVYCRPNTRFVAQYLTGVGALKRLGSRLNLHEAWRGLQSRLEGEVSQEGGDIHPIASLFEARSTLVMRPLQFLLSAPHLFAGWLSSHKHLYRVTEEQISWVENPLFVLKSTYHFLNLERREGRPASQQIWDHDEALLTRGLEFYRDLKRRLNCDDWVRIEGALVTSTAPEGISDDLWTLCRGAHFGHQAGLKMLSLLVRIGADSGLLKADVNEAGQVELPQEWADAKQQAELISSLAPPPPARSGELVAVSGGMFYPREAPDQPKLIEVGDHFEEGQALYIIEVMKMFNKVYAPFAGTVTEALIEGEGVIIKKGQPLFKVKPDLEVAESDPLEERRVQIALTQALLAKL